MFDFLTLEELYKTAEIVKGEIEIRASGIKSFRETRGKYENRTASGHELVTWEMQLAAIEAEIKRRVQ